MEKNITTVTMSEHPHHETGEPVLEIRVHWNANQVHRTDLTESQALSLAHQILGALAGKGEAA